MRSLDQLVEQAKTENLKPVVSVTLEELQNIQRIIQNLKPKIKALSKEEAENKIRAIFSRIPRIGILNVIEQHGD